MGMDLEAWLLVSVRLDCKRRLCWIPAAACPTSWMGAARRKSHCFSFLFWHCFFGGTWMRRRRPVGVSVRIYFKRTDGFHLLRVGMWQARVSSRVLHHFFLISRWRVCRRRYLLYFMSSSLPGVFRLLCASFGQPSALLRTLRFVCVLPFLSLFASQFPTHLLRGVSAGPRHAAIRLFRAFHGDDDPHAFFPRHHGHLSTVVVPCPCRQGLSQEGRARGRRHGHRRCTRHHTSFSHTTIHSQPWRLPLPSSSLSLPLSLSIPLSPSHLSLPLSLPLSVPLTSHSLCPSPSLSQSLSHSLSLPLSLSHTPSLNPCQSLSPLSLPLTHSISQSLSIPHTLSPLSLSPSLSHSLCHHHSHFLSPPRSFDAGLSRSLARSMGVGHLAFSSRL